MAMVPARVAELVAAAVIRTDATPEALGAIAAAACRAVLSYGAVDGSSVGAEVTARLGALEADILTLVTTVRLPFCFDGWF